MKQRLVRVLGLALRLGILLGAGLTVRGSLPYDVRHYLPGAVDTLDPSQRYFVSQGAEVAAVLYVVIALAILWVLRDASARKRPD